MKAAVKNTLIYVGIVAFLLVLAYAFVPEVLSGKIVNQSDISGWRGMAQETIEWNKAHPDDKALWTDSMFGGMPTVTLFDSFDADMTKPLYNLLLWGKRPGSYLFIALLGAFLMMLAFGVNRFVAVIGAIAVAFCAYNFQIIQVGHNTKMQAIALAPWVLAAVAFTYRMAFKEGKWRKWLPLTVLGAVLFALSLSFQVKANHIQITYYLAIVVLVYALGLFFWVLKKENRERLSRFLTASVLLLVLGFVGIGTNANKLLPTYAYAPFTMRGGSELSGENTNAKGLSLDYATAWSYGIGETPNMLIPNYNGGSSSGSLDENSATWKLFKKYGSNPKQVCKALPLYWGPQPFTAGPMYIGAICIFLFILGLFLLEGKDKWWLLVCVVLSIMLSWGNHFMWLTELFFKYAPFYNKFRTVSMALVTLQFCIPLLAVMTLDRIVKLEFPHRQVVKAIWKSLAISGGFCLLVALIPAIAGNFVASSDSSMQDIIADALRQDRKRLLQLDAWRSFMLILTAAFVLVWSYTKSDPFVVSGRLRIAAVIIGVLVLFDMWSVGKRYLNKEDFITPRNFDSQFDERTVDKIILQDEDPSYRVLDLSVSTFNDSKTSYRHKSIGGYCPAKMQRYQDLIDRYLSKEMQLFYATAGQQKTLEGMQAAVPSMPVLSMLNCKYIIVDASLPPIVNPAAMGSAWFVNQVVPASTADEEIMLLGLCDVQKDAVIKASDAEKLSGLTGGEESDFVQMKSYTPNRVEYSYSCSEDRLAVFSEVFHPSWKASLEDGTPVDLMRADWILRSAVLPSGTHTLIMQYQPRDYVLGKSLSRACSILLLLLALGSLVFCSFETRRENA